MSESTFELDPVPERDAAPQPAPPAGRSEPAANVLGLQRSAGNAAVSSALDGGRQAPPALVPTPRPQSVARAENRCACGGVVPPGETECAECRGKRVAGDPETSGALARAAQERREASETGSA